MRNTKRLLTVILAIAAMFALSMLFTGCKGKKDDDKKKDPLPVDTTEYTVSFYNEDGTTLIEERKVVHGSSISAPAAPEKEGYNGDWEYFDLNGEPIYNSIVTCNMKATPTYTIKDYPVIVRDSITDETLYAGTINHGTVLDLYNEYELQFLLEDLGHKPGYEFMGLREDGETGYVSTITVTSAYDIVAEYKALEYTVKFVHDDGHDTIIKRYDDVLYGEIALESAPEIEGKEFSHWETEEIVGGRWTMVEAGKSGELYLISKDTTFYAVYKDAATQG